MEADNKDNGSASEFDASWRKREESYYNHWTAGIPKNQVQLAFRKHWEVFQLLLGGKKTGRCLEVGCGRGSISSYFAAAGWDTVLLDYSSAVLEIAEKIFNTNGHKGHFVCGDAQCLPYRNGELDIVISIGLLEHFRNVEQLVGEQWRVLGAGGWLFAYIVPENFNSVQKYFGWVNSILKLAIGGLAKEKRGFQKKEKLYRNDFTSETYIPILKKNGAERIFVSGMYPLPMISHSPEFPFTLLPKPCEVVLTGIFAVILLMKRFVTGRHGWLCSENTGQAFLVAAQKGNSG